MAGGLGLNLTGHSASILWSSQDSWPCHECLLWGRHPSSAGRSHADMAWFNGIPARLKSMTVKFTKGAHLPLSAREHNFSGLLWGGMEGSANSFRVKEEHSPASPTNNPGRILKAGEDPEDFLPKCPNTTSYCIHSLWVIALLFASFCLSSLSAREVPAVRVEASTEAVHSGHKRYLCQLKLFPFSPSCVQKTKHKNTCLINYSNHLPVT